MTKYTAATIERIRRVSQASGYHTRKIAQTLGVSETTVGYWATLGWVSPEHRSLREIQAAQALARLKAAIVRCQGDVRAVARELHVTYHTARCAIGKAGLTDFLIASSRERRCRMCGAAFRRPERNRVYCSPECLADAKRKCALDRYERSRGEHAFTPNAYERNAQQTRAALWEAFGNVARAARALGKAPNGVWSYIKHHRLYDYLAKCRARLRDPDELRLLLEVHEWDHVRAAASLGLSGKWLLQHARRIGHPEVVAVRPCIECGRMHQRTGTGRANTVCSRACRAERQRRYARERYARMKQQQEDACTRV